MSEGTNSENPEAEYWNNEGGQRWVRYIDRLEVLAGTFNDCLFDGVNAQPGESVLDIGCGGGPTSAAYARAVGESGRVVGVDISEVILDIARQRYSNTGNLSFVTADAGTHDFSSSAFDIVASRFGVMFFPDPIAAFKNIRRALNPKGRLCVVCWRGIEENPWMAEAAKAAFTVLPRPQKAPPGTPGPFSLSDPDRFKPILDEAQFKHVEFSKFDARLSLGNLEQSLEIMCNLGPAAAAMRDAEPEQRNEALQVLRELLATFETPSGVLMDAAVWRVDAKVE